jgi:peptidoglycan/LPS O-acetylase OafA/YrhL
MSPSHGTILGNHWAAPSPPNLSGPLHAAKYCLDLLRPSFLRASSAPRQPLGRTSYLDGLRGFAAFLVYLQHHEQWAHDAMSGTAIFENVFGHGGRYHAACLPGLRLFFSGGHFAVAVFFVISGYVLAAKPLALVQGGEYVGLGDVLASAVFRRWLRLYIPVVCTTFVYMTSWHAFGLWTDSEQEESYGGELWKWYCGMKNFSFVFRTGGEPWFSYNVHVWSIDVEMRGSLVVYTALLAFSRATRNARLWCEVGLIGYFMYIVDGSYFAMFVAGMLLCDLDLLARSDDLPRFFSRLESFKELIFYKLFIFSIYLGGVPSNSSDFQVLKASSGWYYLSFLTPQAVFDYKWFYLFWAATFLVASTPHIPWLKRFFETRMNQYLGRISFAFYLVHGPILFTLGDRLYVAAGWSRVSHRTGLPGWIDIFRMSKAGPLGLEFSFLVPHLILLPLTLWLAEIVTKLLDRPTVKFTQWAYARTLAPSAKS